jgi:hypothetical protein
VSTLLYAAMTANREAAQSKTSQTTAPGVKTYVDALAAIIPAEALTLHAAILGWTTGTGTGGKVVYKDPGALKASFVLLILLTIGLYVIRHMMGSRKDKWGGTDFVRVAIPPAAFVAWAMIQTPSVFNAIWTVRLDRRYIAAAFAAIILGVLAQQLGNVADNSTPKTPKKR